MKYIPVIAAIQFGPQKNTEFSIKSAKEAGNITSVSDQQIVHSFSKNPRIKNFRMSQIGVDTSENDILQDPPVIEAHTASSGDILEEDLVEIDSRQQDILYKLLALFHTLYGFLGQHKNLNGKNIAGSWISRINTYLKRAKIRYI